MPKDCVHRLPNHSQHACQHVSSAAHAVCASHANAPSRSRSCRHHGRHHARTPIHSISSLTAACADASSRAATTSTCEGSTRGSSRAKKLFCKSKVCMRSFLPCLIHVMSRYSRPPLVRVILDIVRLPRGTTPDPHLVTISQRGPNLILGSLSLHKGGVQNLVY